MKIKQWIGLVLFISIVLGLLSLHHMVMSDPKAAVEWAAKMSGTVSKK